MRETPGGAVNAPDMQACFRLEEQVETKEGPGLCAEVPEHCALEKTLKFEDALLVHESVAHWVGAPPPEGVMGKQPINWDVLEMTLPEQSAVENWEICW